MKLMKNNLIVKIQIQVLKWLKQINILIYINIKSYILNIIPFVNKYKNQF